MSLMDQMETLRVNLKMLRQLHRQLDGEIMLLSETIPMDSIGIKRLKKRKLELKDKISRLEKQLYPDIIA